MKGKIGIISDPHATPAPVEEAMALFHQQGVDQILCAGDIAGYGQELEETVALLVANQCQSIMGNHEEWYLHRMKQCDATPAYDYLGGLPSSLEMTIAGRSLHMVHTSPMGSLKGGIRLLDITGAVIDKQKREWVSYLQEFDCDLLVVGHTHQVFAEQLGSTLVINPGSTLCNHSCAVVTFPELRVEWFSLSGKGIIKSWNWGMGMAGIRSG